MSIKPAAAHLSLFKLAPSHKQVHQFWSQDCRGLGTGAFQDTWFDQRTARGVLGLTEQALAQRHEYSLHFLHAELRDDDEPDMEDQ